MSALLTDRFGRKHSYLRISLTDRCNLRCTYCMPADGLDWKSNSEILTDTEIIRIAKVFAEEGVTKIRLTGGEPTLRHGIENLMGELSQIPGVQELLMTTNGLTLRDHVLQYKASGLSGLNISLDTLQRERYKTITRRDQFDEAMAGIDAALQADLRSLKINVVVMSGVNDDEVLDFVHRFKDQPINVRFIEFMPFKSNGWAGSSLVPFRELKAKIEEQFNLVPIQQEPSAVAKDFGIEGYPGTVSFITSMTESFCGTCNRVRLTADGAIKSCLFFNHEISVRDLLRSGVTDEDLRKKIREAILLKPEAHGAPEELARSDNRSMIQIGG